MMKTLPPYFIMFDVESVGLHGEGFAVGYTVVDKNGNYYEENIFSCDPDKCQGTDKSRVWIKENVPNLTITHATAQELRTQFWDVWIKWKSLGAVLIADCCWPVESRFLADCVDDDLENREFEGPYPLYDLSSFLLALGKSPFGTNSRQADELPMHNPLADARQSARQLLEAINL